MKRTLAPIAAALLLALSSTSAFAGVQYVMRVPALVKCPAAGCSSGTTAPSTTAPDTPSAPDPAVPTGTLTSNKAGGNLGLIAMGASGGALMTFTNTGAVPVTNMYASISGAGFSFVQSANPRLGNKCGTPTAPITLAPGGTCTAQITFSPQATGAAAGGVSITAKDTSKLLAMYPLTASAGIAQFTANPQGTIDFGTVPVGSTATRVITFSNPGTAPVQFGYTIPVSATGMGVPGVTQVKTCQLVGSYLYLDPGQSCTVSITLTANSVGRVDSIYATDSFYPSNIQPVNLTLSITGQ